MSQDHRGERAQTGRRCHACDQVREDVGEELPLCAQCAKAHRMGYRCGEEMAEWDAPSPTVRLAVAFLLTRIGSWTNARWDQHLRHEIGDAAADAAIRWIAETFRVKEFGELPASTPWAPPCASTPHEGGCKGFHGCDGTHDKENDHGKEANQTGEDVSRAGEVRAQGTEPRVRPGQGSEGAPGEVTAPRTAGDVDPVAALDDWWAKARRPGSDPVAEHEADRADDVDTNYIASGKLSSSAPSSSKSPRLMAYLALEQAMLVLDEVDDPLAEAVRDAMDPVWASLDVLERSDLNRRSRPTQAVRK
jgi:hypothetical protein